MCDTTSHESITLSVVRLAAYGDEPTWIATYVAGTLNVAKNELHHVLLVGLGVHRSSREHDGMFLRHNPEIAGEGVVLHVLQVIPSHDEIVRDGILQCRDAALDLSPVTNIKEKPREEQKRTYVVGDATSHKPITNPVVRLEAYGQTRLDRHAGTLNVSNMKCVMYFRIVMRYTSATVSKTSSVPDTTVDRLYAPVVSKESVKSLLVDHVVITFTPGTVKNTGVPSYLVSEPLASDVTEYSDVTN